MAMQTWGQVAVCEHEWTPWKVTAQTAAITNETRWCTRCTEARVRMSGTVIVRDCAR